MSAITSLVSQLLTADAEDDRFEAFACDILSQALGVIVVPTHVVWDKGRDGVAISPNEIRLVVAASVRKDAETKIRETAARLVEAGVPDVVYFVSSRALTQQRIDVVRAEIAVTLGVEERNIHILGVTELAMLATREYAAVQKHYGAELAAMNSLAQQAEAEAKSAIPLQVAHLLYTDAELAAARTNLEAELVLEAMLRVGRKMTKNEISAALQSSLRMSAPYPLPTVEKGVACLIERGHLELVGADAFALTDGGTQAGLTARSRAVASLDSLKLKISSSLADQLGFALSPVEFEAVWHELIERVSYSLARYGERFLELVSSFARTGDHDRFRDHGTPLLRNACHQAAGMINDAQVREEVEEGLLLVLLEKDGVGNEWLLKIASTWLAVCSLGLSSKVQHEVVAASEGLVIGLDTDVVLTLLCEAETGHDALHEMLGHWHAAGGRTYISPLVLSEVAHHAWLAQMEYAEFSSVINAVNYDGYIARRTAKNAFVRAFWKAERFRDKGKFDAFIRPFRGVHERDVRSVEETLRRHGIGQRVDAPSSTELEPVSSTTDKAEYALRKTQRLVPDKLRSGRATEEMMKDDARLIAELAAISGRRGHRPVSAVFLLTSSKRLCIAIRRTNGNGRVFGAAPSALAAVLAAGTPGGVTPRTVAALLLNEEAGRPVSAVLTALSKVLLRAGLAELLPRAKKVTLERQLELAIVDVAKRTSKNRDVVAKAVLNGEDRDLALSTFGEALRKVAIGQSADALIRALTEQLDSQKDVKAS